MKNAIILLFSFCFLILFNSCKNNISLESIQNINTAIELSLRQNAIRQETIFYSAKIEKQKPVNFKYSILFKGVEFTFNEYDNIHKLKDELINDTFNNLSVNEKNKIITSLKDELIKRDSTVYYVYHSTLTNDGRIFGLKEKEIKKRLDLLLEKIKKSQTNLHSILTETSKNEEMIQLKLNQVLLTASINQTYFMNWFEELYATCFRINFGIIPVIVPKNNCIKKGEYFEADIYVGTYHNSFDPNSTFIVANGDTIKLDDAGKANYKIKTTESGEFKLDMNCFIENPDSKDYHKVSSTYEYRVD